MRNQQQKEITVKTAKGEEFKFGGISENFTRKLFEWEERRNIAPESSTIGQCFISKIEYLVDLFNFLGDSQVSLGATLERLSGDSTLTLRHSWAALGLLSGNSGAAQATFG